MATATQETETKFTVTYNTDRKAEYEAEVLQKRLDNVLVGADPIVEYEHAKKDIEQFQAKVEEYVLDLAKSDALSVARHLGFQVKTRTTVKDVAKWIAARALDGYGLEKPFKRLRSAASKKEMREHYVTESARRLTYWAASDVYLPQRFHRDRFPSVEAALKYWGLLYRYHRGDDVPVFGSGRVAQPLGVEEALHAVGTMALTTLLTGEIAGENMMEQIRIGDLMDAMYGQVALKHVVRMTLGALQYDQMEPPVAIQMDHHSDYIGWSTDLSHIEP